MLLVGRSKEGVLLPEFRAEVAVGVTEGVEDSLDVVTHGTGVTTCRRVAVINTGHVQKLLTSRRRNKSGSARSRDKTHTNRTTLSSDLAGHSVGHTTLTSPVSTTDRSDIKLSRGDSTTDGSGNLRRALYTKTNVSLAVANGNESLETGTLTSRRLLLDRHDLHDLILELVLKEVVDDLGLLNRKGEEKDLLNGTNLSFLHKTTKLCYGNPNVFIAVATASTATTATTATVTTSASASTKTSTLVRHIFIYLFKQTELRGKTATIHGREKSR
mmetsp:Transcript_12047/g.17552  ORF Transcript_12047/g.17552 Transcript_12047/m.17552 type:complete len:272 (+) Transcript_12047:237-1052(+)